MEQRDREKLVKYTEKAILTIIAVSAALTIGIWGALWLIAYLIFF